MLIKMMTLFIFLVVSLLSRSLFIINCSCCMILYLIFPIIYVQAFPKIFTVYFVCYSTKSQLHTFITTTHIFVRVFIYLPLWGGLFYIFFLLDTRTVFVWVRVGSHSLKKVPTTMKWYENSLPVDIL